MSLHWETERLIMRPFEVKDAPLMIELNSDPDVVRYVDGDGYDTVEKVERFIRDYGQYDEYKMGRLSMFLKETGEYIGWSGLKYRPESDTVDVGYRLMKKHWGKGYATESARASLDYGFKTLGLNKIIAMAMMENTASINVFKKLGMRYTHNSECDNHPAVVYEITKEEWK